MKRCTILLLTVAVTELLAMHSSALDFTLPDWIVNSCVFIMKDNQAIGTGFIIPVEMGSNIYLNLISAKHVIADVVPTNASVLDLRFNRPGTNTLTVRFPLVIFKDKAWAEHSDPAVDIAVVPLAIIPALNEIELGMQVVAKPDDDYFATRKWLEKYKISPGDAVFFVGMVPYLSKQDRNLVLARFGKLSLLAGQPIDLPGGRQRAHFIDCASFGGNSGSPAYVQIQRDESGKPFSGYHFSLLGVIAEFVPSPLRTAKLTLDDNKQQEIVIGLENTGITKVVPTDYLVEILFSEEMNGFRREIDSLGENKRCFSFPRQDN